jgi:DNA repair protein RadA/Sms
MKLNVSLKNWKQNTNILNLDVPQELEKTIKTGIAFIDNALGEGITPSSAILLTGTPGAGKSTLSLQIANSVTANNHVALYNSGEESLFQIRKVTKRLGFKHGFVAGQDLMIDDVLEHSKNIRNLHKGKQFFLVCDSLQTLDDGKYQNGMTNSMTAVRCTEAITDFCKDTYSIAFLIGQVTKEGEFSGKQAIKHAIDVHLHLSIDLNKKSDTYGERVLEVQKNRFGPAGKRFTVGINERGLYMKEQIE